MEIEKLSALVCAVQQGDRQAADELYMQTHQGLYYYISKTVNDAELAQDLLQETFIEIYQTIGNLKEPAAFLKWSRQIAYHRCTAYGRKTRDLLVDENEDGLSVLDTIEEERAEFIPDEALDKEDLKKTIRAMLAELPIEQRSALMLRYFDEISVKEIAEIQGVTEGTVKSRLNYARKSLQKSVETYEKKNGVKLRCAGAVPLLLWLFANEFGAASASGAASAAAGAAAGAVAEGVKAAGRFAAKKVIAGIAAAAVVAGGAATAFLLNKAPEKPMQWYGYGDFSSSLQARRFELEVDEMDDDSISGRLEASHLYEYQYGSDFTGTGREEDGIVTYTITYEEPWSFVLTYEQMELIYDKAEDSFSLDDAFCVTMDRVSRASSRVLVENGHWSGLGEDRFYLLESTGHLFDIQIHRMTEDAVSGQLTVSYEDQVDHLTAFTGRGYLENGLYHFELLLETPRTDTSPLFDMTADRCWLQYDPEKETLELFLLSVYSANLEKGK